MRTATVSGARWIGALALTLAAGCSSGGSSPTTTDASTTSDGTSPAPTREPKLHRPTAIACPADREPGHPGATPRPGDACATDADCADASKGHNGRCNETLGGNACTYDACATDADCGSAGVCACRLSSQGGANVCFRGNCRTDVDCKGGWCSPSAVDVSSSCLGLGIGMVGFFCHAATDECVDDADCPVPGNSCAYDPDRLHFKCMLLRCRG